MKKITGIVAVFLSMIMIASCGGTSQVAEQEDAVRETVTSFSDAVFDYDLDAAKDYVLDEDIITEIEDSLNMDTFVDAIGSSAGFDVEELFSDTSIKHMIQKIMSAFNYEISTVDINKNEAKVDVKLSIPDFEGLDSSSMDIEGMLKEAFDFDINDPNAILTEYSKRTGKSVTDISSGNQDDFMKEIFSAFNTEFETFMDLAMDNIISQANNGKINTTTGSITLTQENDGTWKISAMD